jgi:NitT/TauT family transport system substrate-binding protein
VGYGPFFVAAEKGFFADEGVEVDMIHMAFGGEEWLLDGQIDAMTSTVDTPILNSGPNPEPTVCLFALGDSFGGDRIVANNDIHSIDLEGKSAAFQELAASEFYLNVLLQEAGMSVADIEPVALSVQDAAEAFRLG